jgi:hypothetical protein
MLIKEQVIEKLIQKLIPEISAVILRQLQMQLREDVWKSRLLSPDSTTLDKP